MKWPLVHLCGLQQFVVGFSWMFGMQWHASGSQRNMAFIGHLHGHCVMPCSSQMLLTRVASLIILPLLDHHGMMCFELNLGGSGSTAKEQFHHLKSYMH